MSSAPPYSFVREGITQLASVFRGRALVLTIVIAALIAIEAAAAGVVLGQQHPDAEGHGYRYGANVGGPVATSALLDYAYALAQSPDGGLYAIVGSDLVALDPTTLSFLGTQPLGEDAGSDGLIASSGGRVFVIGTGSVHHYAVDKDGAFSDEGEIHLVNADFARMKVSPDGKVIYAPALDDSGLYVLDLTTDTSKKTDIEGLDRFFPLAVADESGTVFVSSSASGVVAYTPDLGKELARYSTPANVSVRVTAVSPDGTHICLSDSTILSFDGMAFSTVSTMEEWNPDLGTTKVDLASPDCVGFTPDGTAVVRATPDALQVVDVLTGKPLFTIATSAASESPTLTNPIALSDPSLGFVRSAGTYANPTLYRYTSDAPRFTLLGVLMLIGLVDISLLALGILAAFLLPAARHRRVTAAQREALARQRADDGRRAQAERVRTWQEATQQADHATRVQQLAKWEAAYSELHPGQPVPAMPVHVGAAASATSERTSTLAILALIFGIAGGLLGIIFGHAAHAQIRKTGEKGWGLATAGLVFGYLGLIVVVGLVVAAVVIPH